MHPIENIRGAASDHLSGRRIVLGLTGSIGIVKSVELARELVRHGADVQCVMSSAATGLLAPAAMEFATGNPVVTKLTGQVEHVQWFGDVPDAADLFLIAPATANTISKMAQGIDDSPVTTCATVAFGAGRPVVVAPAMHDVMMDHPIVAKHCATLRDELGVTWVEPKHEEKKAKLADLDAIVEAVIHRLAVEQKAPLVGKTCLVVGGATAQPVDPVRILTNRSSGRSAVILATELRRLGADVTLWYGHATTPLPTHIRTVRFETHEDLEALAKTAEGFDQLWMPAAIADYVPKRASQKIASGERNLSIELSPASKIIEALRAKLPRATLVAFKAESNPQSLLARAQDRLARYGAQFVVANTSEAFGATQTDVILVHAGGHTTLQGSKEEVLRTIVRTVAGGDASALVSIE